MRRRACFRWTLLATLLTCAAAPAAPVTWEYDVAVELPDTAALWTAPTAIGPNQPAYIVGYSIDAMLVDARLGLAVVRDLDVTDELPAEFRTGTQFLDGPLPVLIIDDRVANPEPPAEPGFAADMQIGIDAAGRGYLALENVVLSLMETEFAGVPITVELTKVRFQGTVSAAVAPRVRAQPEQLTIPEQGSATFTVQLDTPPAENVPVTVTRLGGDEDLRVQDGAALLFTPDNWNVPQIVTVSASADDDGVTGSALFECSAPAHIPAQVRVTEGEADCNNNGQIDVDEISAGLVADCNDDGVPDECQVDTDHDGVIDPCDGCPNDPLKTAPGDCGCGNPESADCGDRPAETDEPNTPGTDTTTNEPPAEQPAAEDAIGDGVTREPNASPADATPTDPNQAAQSSPPADDPNGTTTGGPETTIPCLLAWFLPLCGLGTALWAPLTAAGLLGWKLTRHL